jgi:hypothetical protein
LLPPWPYAFLKQWDQNLCTLFAIHKLLGEHYFNFCTNPTTCVHSSLKVFASEPKSFPKNSFPIGGIPFPQT